MNTTAYSTSILQTLCPVCGINIACSPHHIKPRAEGGSDDHINIVDLCRGCHDIVEEIYNKAGLYYSPWLANMIRTGFFSSTAKKHWGTSKEGIAAYQQWWRDNHRDVIRERNILNREHYNAWRAKNRDSFNERMSIWREANREHLNDYMRNYHLKRQNKELILLNYKAWYREYAETKQALTMPSKQVAIPHTNMVQVILDAS